MSEIDVSYLLKDDAALISLFKQYFKALIFLAFYDDATPLAVVGKDRNPRTYLDVFSEVLAKKLSMTDEDRDLVVMRHNFVIEDPKTKKRWKHYSTLIASVNSLK